MAERSDKDRTTLNLTPVRGRIEQLRPDSAWKALSLSKKVLLLLEEYLDLLEQNDRRAKASHVPISTDPPKTLEQLILRNWEVLAETSGIPLERLKLLRDGKSNLSETERLRVAIALSLPESFVSTLPLKDEDNQPKEVD